MSRMGKVPLVPPDGVTVKVDDKGHLTIKGPKGELSLDFSLLIKVRQEDGKFWIDRLRESRKAKAQQGLVHRLFSNMITGVTKGFRKELEIVGVGYRAAVEGKELVLSLGYTNPVHYAIADDVKVSVDKQIIAVEGIDKQRVGQVAAEIRKWRKPDNYKGKGIRYVGERVKIKPGKAAVGSGF